MNNQNLNKLKEKMVDLREEKKDLLQEREDLKVDKETANAHRLALVKKENNQVVDEEEENAISDTKENYSQFFEEEIENSDPEVETTPEYKERKQVSQIIEYISDEIKSNSEQIKKINKEWSRIHKLISEKASNLQSASESSSSVNKESKAISGGEESNKQSNVQINKNTGDYIDNLPKEYNPFDDLGDD